MRGFSPAATFACARHASHRLPAVSGAGTSSAADRSTARSEGEPPPPKRGPDAIMSSFR